MEDFLDIYLKIFCILLLNNIKRG